MLKLTEIPSQFHLLFNFEDNDNYFMYFHSFSHNLNPSKCYHLNLWPIIESYMWLHLATLFSSSSLQVPLIQTMLACYIFFFFLRINYDTLTEMQLSILNRIKWYNRSKSSIFIYCFPALHKQEIQMQKLVLFS